MSTIKVACAQINPTAGDLSGNAALIRAAYNDAQAQGADLVVYPELCLPGYGSEDLFFSTGFLSDTDTQLNELARQFGDNGGPAAVVGTTVSNGHVHDENVRRPRGDHRADRPYNSAAIFDAANAVDPVHKTALLNTGVFDELRYFIAPLATENVRTIRGVRVGVLVCEDLWVEPSVEQRTPAEMAAAQGAQVLVCLNASPFETHKQQRRELQAARVARSVQLPIVYVNTVGAQDELIFDGGSFVCSATGEITGRLNRFVAEVGTFVVDLDAVPDSDLNHSIELPSDEGTNDGSTNEDNELVEQSHDELCSEVWSALTLGLADYMDKNGASDVVVGLSGGVDSAIVAVIAADALGADHVHAVLMPSRFSSQHSVDDAEALVKNLGIDSQTVSIEAGHTAFRSMLALDVDSHDDVSDVVSIADQNVQARVRGVILMGLSNLHHWLVLATSNKSEVAVGYSTLYGDSVGAIGVIKDVPKTLVYELCHWRNRQADHEVIPSSILTKAPSAELKPDQRDEDSLPDYSVLDPIIMGYVDDLQTVDELIAEGHDPAAVRRVVAMIDNAEFKRRQTAFALRISSRSFGRERRMPITQRYRGGTAHR